MLKEDESKKTSKDYNVLVSKEYVQRFKSTDHVMLNTKARWPRIFLITQYFNCNTHNIILDGSVVKHPISPIYCFQCSGIQNLDDYCI